MRAIWKGAVSFGLVNVPVRLYTATQNHGTHFHQVHRTDGGRIRMHRMCSVCGVEVAYDQLAKGYESPDGRLVVLDDEDFASLPLATGKAIDVIEFVPGEQVDPISFDRAYYLEPEAHATRPYALLREALTATNRMALAKVTLRQRECMAMLRVRGKVIVMQTLLWPDEIRSPEFDVLDTDIDLRPQELAMAESLVASLAADFTPDQYENRYDKAVAELIGTKLISTNLTEAEPAPVPETGPADPGPVNAGLADPGPADPGPANAGPADPSLADPDLADLLAALQRSVERARADREKTAPDDASSGRTPSSRSQAGSSQTKKAATKKAATENKATGKTTPKTPTRRRSA